MNLEAVLGHPLPLLQLLLISAMPSHANLERAWQEEITTR